MKLINWYKKTHEKGQSILEVAVSLGLVTIIITILTITTLNSLRNSQFAKNQVLASSYAQQGLELVKAMRQRDCQITIGTNNYYWYDTAKGTLIWNASPNPLPEGNLNTYSFVVNNPSCQIYQNDQTEHGETLENLFNRKIKLERLTSNNNVIRVTVDVSWNDFSGQHNAQNVSIVTNY